MKSRSKLMVGVAGLLVLGSVVVTVPALADTTTVFEVQAGTLSISEPASADLGAGDPSDAISGQLGSVMVTDDRAALVPAWEASVVATDFTTGGGTGAETIPASNVEYWSGGFTATTGSGTFTPGQVNAGAAQALDTTTPLTAATHTGGTGNNMAQWNPTLVVNVPFNGVAGTYTGTVTHSVA